MVFLYLFLFVVLQLSIYRESKFQYSHNNELLLEKIQRGRDALDDILKAKRKAEAEYKKGKNKRRSNYEEDPKNIFVKEIKCYDYVLDQLNNLSTYNCNGINENNKSLLALAKTKCIFVKSTRDFPDESSGCVLNPKNLTKLQIYLYNKNLVKKFDDPKFSKSLNPKELNEIEKITNPCTLVNDSHMSYESEDSKIVSNKYDILNNENNEVVTETFMSFKEMELNKKLCENLKYKIITNCTNKKHMSDVAFQIYHSELNHIDDICFYIQSIEWNKRTEENINLLADASHHITKQITRNLEKMMLIENVQTKQIENTNKFDLFLKTLKSDFSEIIQLLINIKKHHDNFIKFLRGFQVAVSYLLVLIFVLIVTSKNQTSRGRKRLFTCVMLCYLTEYFFRKLFYFVTMYALDLKPFVLNCIIKGIRYSYILVGAKIIVKTIITYKEPMRKIEEELIHIKKIVEQNQNSTLVEKEIQDVPMNLPSEMDYETAHILNLWSSYNGQLDSYYSDDSDYALSSEYSSETSSSDVSLVTEETPPTASEDIPLNELSIGERIEHLHREKRPIRFYCIPSPHNIIAFTESPVTFTETVERNHEELMRIREKRIEDMLKKTKKDTFKKKKNIKETDDNNGTIILENDEQNDTCDLYELSNNKESTSDGDTTEQLTKYYSISSRLNDE